ncbi:MAG: lasso peptide biosynthesis B2 protein [Sphingomicrobium sp.]
MVLLTGARLLVAYVPLRYWRGRLGAPKDLAPQSSGSRVQSMVGQVERAAVRLPVTTQCLPRAMALSWLLRRRGVAHEVVLAARPTSFRGDGDRLHAWVERGGVKVLGDLPGPWIETLRLGN